MRKRNTIVGIVLTLSLLLSSAVTTFAAGDVTTEVRGLLESSYVDPVSTQVLNAGSVDKMLKLLGDPYTSYFTAEEYQSFLDSLDMTFSGIGIYMDMLPQGVLVTSVITGSPAEEAGLRAQDLIISAGGQSLAGLSAEVAASYLRGPEGSRVELVIKRGEETFTVWVTRRAIEVPTVTGEMLDGQIGYIEIASFGSNTPQLFDSVVQGLKAEGADSWIIDLRDNPGGYLSSALDLAGYFIGLDTAVQIKERDSAMTPYLSYPHTYVLDEPVIFLTNGNSASASEILAAAVKDQEKATLVGSNTYGKGTVQSLYGLSNGGALKMTVARFYSPDGNEINQVGVSPDLTVEQEDARQAAELLLTDSTASGQDHRGYTEVAAGPNRFEVSLEQARTEQYWAAWSQILGALDSASDIRQGTATGWQAVSTASLEERWPLYYPEYQAMGELPEIPLDKQFTVRFNGPVDWNTVTGESIELIDSASGERIPLVYQPLNERELKVIPENRLASGTEYWLVIHPSMKGPDGKSMVQGTVTVARTAGSRVTVLGTEVGDTKSARCAESASSETEGRLGQLPERAGYGAAIWVK